MEVEFIEPFKILKFTITKIITESNKVTNFNSIVYEIPPGEMHPTLGWIDYDENSFDDYEIKAAVSLAIDVWTPEIRQLYKDYVIENHAVVSPPPEMEILNDQSNEILFNALYKDDTNLVS